MKTNNQIESHTATNDNIVPEFDIVFQNFFLKKRGEEVSRPGQIPNQKPIVMVINCLCL